MAKKSIPRTTTPGAGAGAQVGMNGSKTQTPTINKNFGKNLSGVSGSVWKPTDVLHPKKK